jgi:hypothetical protein
MYEIIPDRQIYRSALALIDEHQDAAWAEAMKRSDRYWLAANDEEMHFWREIANAIQTIQTGSPFGATIH